MSKFKGLVSTYYLLILVILGLTLAVVLLKAKTSLPAGDLGQVSTQSAPRSATASVETDSGVASYVDDQQGKTTKGTVESDLDTYTNDQLGFKIGYPSGWNMGNYTLNAGVGQRVETKGSAIVFFQQELPATSDKNTILSLYLKAPITVISFNQPISKFKDITKGWTQLVIGGKQASKKVDEKTGRQNIYISGDENSSFEIIFSPQYGGSDQLFGKVLDSFTIL